MSTLPCAFLDSDVVISSLLSSRGAARVLIDAGAVDRWVSSSSVRELEDVVDRMVIERTKLHHTLRRCHVASLIEYEATLVRTHARYVSDEGDAHVVAGVVEAHAQYLITYNLKHFYRDRIKADFDILVMTPALFLQYLRSVCP